MNWQKDKLTIIGFGIIFVILGVFGYLLWDMNKEPMAEVSVTEPTPAPVETGPKVIDPEPVKEKELPDYPITKVDTTGWEFRETKLGDVGIKYKVMNKDLDNRSVSGSVSYYPDFDLGKYDINAKMFGADSKERLGKGYDKINITCIDCCLGCGGATNNFIEVKIIDDKQSTIMSLTDLFSKDNCEYEIIDDGEADGLSSRYNAQSKCNNKPNYDEEKLPPLCVAGSEIKIYSNPFVGQSASDLIQCKVVSNGKDVDDSSSKPVLNLVDRELFIVDLGNAKLAVVSHQLANNPLVYDDYDASTKQKINNLMHTILSTIEVL